MAKKKKWLSKIHCKDCIKGMSKIPGDSVDLAFADPPFNIGYDYDVYDDKVDHQRYIDWSTEWISAVHRALKPNGTFWLAIGDEYAAELKLASQETGFHCRSWVIWYYTFGVNCARKFTRSHAHLFHFVKDKDDFTFRDEDLDNRVPSARELVYNDKRANPKGRLPDDTWIIRPANSRGELSVDLAWSPDSVDPPADDNNTFALRPQELGECFNSDEDTWYFPRVAGTFKERAGFHGCQMPEQLLGRIIRTCTNPGDVVLDPFSGSATTLAVAKKLGRNFVGFELSEDYVKFGTERLESIRVGDRLDGSPEPLKSAKQTPAKKGKAARDSSKSKTADADNQIEKRYDAIQLELTQLGIVEAFRITHDGFSADRVVADPDLNQQFTKACSKLGLVGDPRTWNSLLFRLRKSGKLSQIETRNRTSFSWDEYDQYLFASEIAWQSMLDDGLAKSLDEIFCDPELGRKFDLIAEQFAPGFTPLEYRTAALKLRKEAKVARSRAAVLTAPRLNEMVPLKQISKKTVPSKQGIYIVSENKSKKLYVGETLDLRKRFALIKSQIHSWKSVSETIFFQALPIDHRSAGNLAWQSCLVKTFKNRPKLNCFELRA